MTNLLVNTIISTFIMCAPQGDVDDNFIDEAFMNHPFVEEFLSAKHWPEVPNVWIIKQRNIIEERNTCNDVSEKEKWASLWLEAYSSKSSFNNKCIQKNSSYKLLNMWYRHIKEAVREWR